VTRPDRIETLARDILKLEPAKPEQLITRHDFMDLLARRPIPSAADANGWKPRDEIGALIRNTGGEKNAGAGVAN
jgi:hypothetical protein